MKDDIRDDRPMGGMWGVIVFAIMAGLAIILAVVLVAQAVIAP